MNINHGMIRYAQAIASVVLASTLTACPPPPPVLQLYQADLINQVGTAVSGKADATLNTSILTVAGEILGSQPTDVFTATITCNQTSALSIGSANNNPTIFGDFTGTEADRTVLNNQGCYISVFSGSQLILKGFLKTKG